VGVVVGEVGGAVVEEEEGEEEEEEGEEEEGEEENLIKELKRRLGTRGRHTLASPIQCLVPVFRAAMEGKDWQ